jgi:sulfur-carrier protein
VQVNFYAGLREIVGQKTVDFDFPEEITIGELIDRMVERYPGLQRELLDENGQLYGHVQVFINGRDTLLQDRQLETVLRLEDVINVFPAVGGGLG